MTGTAKKKTAGGIAITVVVAMLTWAGQKLLQVERMGETLKHIEQETHENNEAIQELVKLHLR